MLSIESNRVAPVAQVKYGQVNFKANKVATDVAKTAIAGGAALLGATMAGLAAASRAQVNEPMTLTAGENYEGKTFDVQGIGNSPITVEEVTKENVGKYSKCIDIWYQGDAEKTNKIIAATGKDPRFLHPNVGESIQHYGLEPIAGDYVTHDPAIIEYARQNGLTAFNDKGEECFVNVYNGDKAVIESTYTNADGQLLKDAGGLKGTMEATQCKDMKVALMPVGTKVKPLNDESMKIVGVGDVVCCAAKKGKARNDWYVKSVPEFLKTAKINDEKGNTEFIKALEEFNQKGTRDAAEWNKVIARFS